MIYWVYVLKHRGSGKIYYGNTNDLRRRLKEHGDRWKMIGCEGYAAEGDARERERMLKHYGQSRAHLKKRLRRSFLA